jgi:hypothetical protein
LAHLSDWFWELDSQRQRTGLDENPISWADLAGWSQMTGHRPRRWELAALRRMDMIRLGRVAQVDRVTGDQEKPKMTPGLFLAMFGGGKKK